MSLQIVLDVVQTVTGVGSLGIAILAYRQAFKNRGP